MCVITFLGNKKSENHSLNYLIQITIKKLIWSKNSDLCLIISKLLKDKIAAISFFIYVAITIHQTKVNNALRNDRSYQKDKDVNLLSKL